MQKAIWHHREDDTNLCFACTSIVDGKFTVSGQLLRSLSLLPYPNLSLIHDITAEHSQMRLDEFHIIMGRNWNLWHNADSPKSMSASWCVRCDRSVRGSCCGS